MEKEGTFCWAMTTGEAGMVSQVSGLAEAVGLPWELKTVALRAPGRWLPGHVAARIPLPWLLGPRSDRLEPPWPRLLIACGRRSIAPALAVRRASGGRCFTVYLHDPRIPTHHFDLVAPPRHDGVVGANVVPTRGALHRVTAAKLAEQAERFRPLLGHLPRPLVAVLIGGTSKSYRLTPEIMADVADKLAALSRATGAGLMVTASRRTGAENEAVLRRALEGLPAYVWDGQGENPYFGMLGLADHVVVTEDSVSMVSEACSTGKPVHVIALEGGNARFRRFHEELRRDGITRPFDGSLAEWSYPPVNDTFEIARLIREKLAL
ncbi:mitochondrial fission ELM1 family protein [Telmatospirillum sp. J64-1]|uniref:mitochondrial fission ELM1 family protein n=1 Tax=Telmatospirillum sp. J64-1 TaxID=2502183 RepID=UPI002103D8BF|nr:mitochondrial fission ELM1 family protein [Telmatospirillum sp. J64-1]